ncbi:MAG: CDP-glycerol glycerophosphotransferase family protein [Desulfohalobiaceae bacterium]
MRLLHILWDACLFYIAGLLRMLGLPRSRGAEVWLIGCREKLLSSNSLAMWRYLYAQAPGVKPYVVCPKNTLLPSDFPHGLALRHSTLRAKSILWAAGYITCTHGTADAGWRPVYLLKPPGLIVNLKHGVTGLKYYTRKQSSAWQDYDLICANSELERKLLASSLGIEQQRIAVTGLARLASLKRVHPVNSDLLYFPTYRMQNQQNLQERITHQTGLLLQAVHPWPGQQWVLRLIIHPNLKLSARELTLDPERITLHKADSAELQELLQTADLLVTDYSSIVFDAGFIGVPCVLDWSDLKEYSLERGVFPEFQCQPVGIVCCKEQQLTEEIQRLSSDTDYYRQQSRKIKQAVRRFISFPGEDPRENIVQEARHRAKGSRQRGEGPHHNGK